MAVCKGSTVVVVTMAAAVATHLLHFPAPTTRPTPIRDQRRPAPTIHRPILPPENVQSPSPADPDPPFVQLPVVDGPDWPLTMTFTAAGSPADGTHEWTVSGDGASIVDGADESQVTLEFTEASAVVVTVSYTTPDDDVCEDMCEFTIMAVNLTGHWTLTGFDPVIQILFDEQAEVPDHLEETPGVGIRRRDSILAPGQPGDSEDMVELKVDLGGLLSPPVGVKWFLTRDDESLQVWTATMMAGPQVGGEVFEPGELEKECLVAPGKLWVENVESGWSAISLEDRDAETDEVVAQDRVVFHTFQSVVMVLAGESGLPFIGNALAQGTTDLAMKIALDGYNVRLRAEEDVGFNGLGTAYDVIKRDVDRRSIEHLAIIGYSHGGGATHDLANRLAIAPPASPFSLRQTAYIDAIKQGPNPTDKDLETAPEIRLPPGTLRHINLWQTGDAILQGAAVPGSVIDINVNAPTPIGWGFSLIHKTIDDDGSIHADIKLEVITNVPR